MQKKTNHFLKNNFYFFRDITNHLQFLLRKSGHFFYTSSEREVVRGIKEASCYVSFDPNKEEETVDERTGRSIVHKYKLPDGNIIDVNHCF